MRVGCLVPYPCDRVPSQRFRLEQWAPVLAARGIHLEFIPLLRPGTMAFLHAQGNLARKGAEIIRGCAARLHWAVREARRYDVVVIHREALLIGVDWVERYLSARVPTVFDFDDAVWLPNVSAANRSFGFLKAFSKIDRILGLVSCVSAGCEYLAAHARLFNPSVVVVPTSIDLATYSPPRLHEESDVLTVGWTGSATTAAYLQLVAPVLKRASAAYSTRFRVLGAQIQIPGVDVVCESWAPEREVPFLRTFDVGLKPTPREEWAKGKCPMKDLQYMALAIPPIATRFGTASESIEHGVNGFLCDTDDDWLQALGSLRDANLRRRMGQSARRVVEERYAASVAASKFEDALQSAVRRFAALS